LNKKAKPQALSYLFNLELWGDTEKLKKAETKTIFNVLLKKYGVMTFGTTTFSITTLDISDTQNK
jgi:hypothetical protein